MGGQRCYKKLFLGPKLHAGGWWSRVLNCFSANTVQCLYGIFFYHSLEAYFFPHENDRGHHFGDWVHRYSSSWFYLWGYCSRGRHRHLLFSDAFPYSFEQFPARSCKRWLLNYYQDCTSTRITELKRPGRPMRDELIESIDKNANFYQWRKTWIWKKYHCW